MATPQHLLDSNKEDWHEGMSHQHHALRWPREVGDQIDFHRYTWWLAEHDSRSDGAFLGFRFGSRTLSSRTLSVTTTSSVEERLDVYSLAVARADESNNTQTGQA